jgi:hypothetical protein
MGAHEEEETMIGSWVIRIHTAPDQPVQREYGQAHYVESEITDRLVMRCGRELRLQTAHGTLREFVARRLETRCKQCRGEAGDD